MYKRSIFIIFPLIFAAFFAAIFCSCALSVPFRLNKLSKIEGMGNYYLVGASGVSFNNEDTLYTDKIYVALEERGERPTNVDSSPYGVVIGSKLFFSYLYYQNATGGSNDLPTEYNQKFCTGCIDVIDFGVTVFSVCERTVEDKYAFFCSVCAVGSAAVFYFLDGRVEIYDSSAQKLPSPEGRYKGRLFGTFRADGAEVGFYDLDSGDHCFVDSYGNFRIENYDMSGAQSISNYVFTAEYVCHYSYTYPQGYVYEVFDRATFARLQGSEAEARFEEIKNSDYSPPITYGGKLYSYSFTDNRLIFTSDDQEISIEIQTIRDYSSELREIEEIFGSELTYKDVLCGNGEVYIVLKNDQSFFGTYSHATPPIVFRYDFNGNFEYVGYSTCNSSLLAVIKGGSANQNN